MHLEEKYAMYVAVDAVVFSVVKGSLSVLLVKNKFPPFQDRFALPGGRVAIDETPQAAIARVLEFETGVKDVFLKRFNAYGEVHRDARNRVVSLAFLAFIDAEKFTLESHDDVSSVTWASVSSLSELAYDHGTILHDALERLRLEVQTTNIAAQILPEKFTLSELQTLYEQVLDRVLDKRNFRKRIEEQDIVIETGEERRGGAHRPAKLYRFRKREYQPLADRVNVFV